MHSLNSHRRVGLMAVILFCGIFLAASTPAHAWGPGYPPFPGYSYGSSPYSLGRLPMPPYFAIHPPVYYSQPVPRTYGYSPFAYGPCVMTPEVAAPTPAPKTIINPHVEPQSADESDRLAGNSKVIENPFCADGVKPTSMIAPASARGTMTIVAE